MENSRTTKGNSPSNKLKYDYLVKVKMVGDSNAGKSSIVIRFCEDSFSESTMPTIGIFVALIFENRCGLQV